MPIPAETLFTHEITRKVDDLSGQVLLLQHNVISSNERVFDAISALSVRQDVFSEGLKQQDVAMAKMASRATSLTPPARNGRLKTLAIVAGIVAAVGVPTIALIYDQGANDATLKQVGSSVSELRGDVNQLRQDVRTDVREIRQLVRDVERMLRGTTSTAPASDDYASSGHPTMAGTP